MTRGEVSEGLSGMAQNPVEVPQEVDTPPSDPLCFSPEFKVRTPPDQHTSWTAKAKKGLENYYFLRLSLFLRLFNL